MAAYKIMEKSKTKATVEDRFWAKVNKTESCWLWTAHRDPNGYGRFSDPRLLAAGKTYTTAYAHRVAYEFANGPIPEGLDTDHICRNPACVNPAHLRAVTPRENILAGIGRAAQNARKKRCIRGHNDWIALKNGGRKCRICFNAYLRERWRTNADYRRKCNERRRQRQAQREACAA